MSSRDSADGCIPAIGCVSTSDGETSVVRLCAEQRPRLAILFARLAIVLALLVTSACVSDKSLYYWGHYQESVYNMCHGAGTFDLAQDVQLISQDIARAQAEGRRVPPGVHAHLGYLYYVSGNTGATLQQFNAEKELYPESATFIDGMIRRLQS